MIYKHLHKSVGTDMMVDFSIKVKNGHERIRANFLGRSNEHLCKTSWKSACISHWGFLVGTPSSRFFLKIFLIL